MLRTYSAHRADHLLLFQRHAATMSGLKPTTINATFLEDERVENARPAAPLSRFSQLFQRQKSARTLPARRDLGEEAPKAESAKAETTPPSTRRSSLTAVGDEPAPVSRSSLHSAWSQI